TLGARLSERYGERLEPGPSYDGVERLWPRAAVLAELDPEELPMPRARGRALTALCAALAADEIPLDRSADRAEVRARLLAMPGIGPWTADYIAMRALGDPDVFLPTDIGVKRALAAAGDDATRAAELSHRWRPWRSYGLMHLWASLDLRPAIPRTPTSTKEN
ncbi:MAG: DNA-3-methyladenine glycosylase family protein, partial [Nocardioidaceae bacterium]